MAAVIEIDHLAFAYDAQTTFDFGRAEVRAGEVVVLVGPSGAGKSTLMRLLRGELIPTGGEVRILSERVQTRKDRLVLDETKAGWVPQRDDLQGMMRVDENIVYNVLRMDPVAREARTQTLLRAFHLESLREQKVRELSGGQRQRVSIAKAMMGRPPVLLLDESLAQLDLHTKTAVLLDLKKLVREEGVAALLVLHDPADALFIADRLWVMQHGTLVQQGDPKEIVSQPISKDVAGLFDHINVVRGTADLPGPWRVEGDQKWLYAHEFEPTEACELLEERPVAGGKLQIFAWEDQYLLRRLGGA